MAIDREIIRIEGRLSLSRTEEEAIRREGGRRPVFAITFMYHPDHGMIGTTSTIPKDMLKADYEKMQGSNGGKPLYRYGNGYHVIFSKFF